MYKAAIEFLALADTIAGELPRGRACLADQLRRAATAITLNIAEGAGELAPADKAGFYRMARRSATECGAILDVARTLSLSAVAPLRHGRAILLRIVAMLTGAILKLIDSGSDSGSRSGSKDADTAAETQQRAQTQ